jgi:flagellar biosynthesis protein
MAVDVDSEIPLEAFAAVAEILNYIYRINRIYGGPSRSQSDPEDQIMATPKNDVNGEGPS